MNEISRRRMIKGVAGGMASGMPTAAILADPKVAQTAAAGFETAGSTTGDVRMVSGPMSVSGKPPAAPRLSDQDP